MMINRILGYIFGCNFLGRDTCRGGFIADGKYICAECGRIIHDRYAKNVK